MSEAKKPAFVRRIDVRAQMREGKAAALVALPAWKELADLDVETCTLTEARSVRDASLRVYILISVAGLFSFDTAKCSCCEKTDLVCFTRVGNEYEAAEYEDAGAISICDACLPNVIKDMERGLSS